MESVLLILVLIVCVLVLALASLIFWSFEPRQREPLAPNFQTYVINMRKNTDRMAHFDRQYARSDLAERPYVRIEAVNGYELGDQVKEYVSPKVWLGLNHLAKTKKRAGDGVLTPGMIGCYLSHYSIFEQMTEPYAIIFEDDARIHPKIYKKVIKSIVEEEGRFPSDWDVILLGHWCKMCEPTAQASPDVAVARFFWGTHGYMVSQTGARKLLENREPEITMQIDHYMSYLSQKNKLNVYAIHPSYVVPGNFGTDLQMAVSPPKILS